MQTQTAPIEYEKLLELYEQSLVTIQTLQKELAQLKKLIFGSKHERFIPAADINTSQLSLEIQAEVVEQCKLADVQKISYVRNAKRDTDNAIAHPGRHKLPEHLERRQQIIEPVEDTTGLKRIGEEITEELEYEPGKLHVNQYIRPKYAMENNEGVIIAPMIDRPLPKAIAGPGLLAQVVIDKYVDHLPLYRQIERFRRERIPLSSSTVGDWINGTCALIRPLIEAHSKIILRSLYLHVDETPLKVLDKDKKGTTHKGYYWVYHNSIDRLVLFDYQPTRGREGPQQLLKDFQGYLQTDGYAVYDSYKKADGITVLHCMAHARRMFFEAQQNDLPRATYALEQIALLYDIERRAKQLQLSETEITQLRTEEAVPVLSHLGKWMREQYAMVLPKSVIGKALAYSIQRWDELTVYTTDGKLNIDNNPVENSIRPVAIGRKNYMFAGSHEAAQRSAMLYSLFGTCKLHGINPFVWLRDVLQRIASHPINRIEELLPQNWKLKTKNEAKLN